jgi:hypothetical protein
VHFFDIESGEQLLHVSLEHKTQDVAFISRTRLIVASVLGAPKSSAQPMYDSQLQIVDFDLKKRASRVASANRFRRSHFDCAVISGGVLYITDQYGNRVVALDPDALNIGASIEGYDFPHGLDVRHGMIAVTNYGSSTILIKSLGP